MIKINSNAVRSSLNIKDRELIFNDDFEEASLNQSHWFPYYLPHWNNANDSRPSYTIEDSSLKLFIGSNQAPWCPEHDGILRVSSIQTGHYSGEVGSEFGQHRFAKNLVVKQKLATQKLFLPRFCRLEMRARAKLNDNNLASLWLIGFEETPEQSGEITLMEVFGDRQFDDGTIIGRGIKKITDPHLENEFYETKLPMHMQDWHIYAFEWTATGVDFYLDDELISHCDQSPQYPMQLMLNIYQFTDNEADKNNCDSFFEIDYIRSYEAIK